MASQVLLVMLGVGIPLQHPRCLTDGANLALLVRLRHIDPYFSQALLISAKSSKFKSYVPGIVFAF